MTREILGESEVKIRDESRVEGDGRASSPSGRWERDGKISSRWSSRHSFGYPWLAGYRYHAASLLVLSRLSAESRSVRFAALIGARLFDARLQPSPTVRRRRRRGSLFMEMEQIRNKTRGYSFTRRWKKRLLTFPRLTFLLSLGPFSRHAWKTERAERRTNEPIVFILFHTFVEGFIREKSKIRINSIYKLVKQGEWARDWFRDSI